MTGTLLTQTNQFLPHGVTLRGHVSATYAEILTPDALDFLALLHRQFENERSRLLQLRRAMQQRLNTGWLPNFLLETADIRASDWKVAAMPQDLQDRRVELIGTTDRKLVIHALNSGANVFIADFEEASGSTWEALLSGQVNLRDAVDRTIFYQDFQIGKYNRLDPNPAVLIARPRGWHLLEEHLLIDGQPIAASLFDFGLYCFHNAHRLLLQGSGPYFYLPNLDNRHEAALWNAVFVAAEEALGLAIGTIKSTVLIETIQAAFEMDEILFALRDHIVALSCGRFRSSSPLMIKTCHRRGALAISGMATPTPIQTDPEANEAELARVRADKEREVQAGFDGTWVTHPVLVHVAREVFDRHLYGFNQLSVLREDVQVTATDLLKPGFFC